MLQFQLDSKLMLTPNVQQFTLTALDISLFDYLPGQFIMIHFTHEGKTLRRSYSIANPPVGDNRIEFAAGYVESGAGTQFLWGLKPGDVVQVTGPFGRLVLKDTPPKRYVFVATSTGVTPYRAMLPALKKYLEILPNLTVVILEGVQTQQDLLYEQEFLAWARQTPRVIFQAFLSREEPALSYQHLQHGYVQHGFGSLGLDPVQDCVYLCGNPAMIDDAFALLKERGFTAQQIVREKYISSQ